MIQVYLGNVEILSLEGSATGSLVKDRIFSATGINPKDVYLLQNGRFLPNNGILGFSCVHVIPKLVGGKGGFGSMLRAIGAQIEKTTNREACRDLSGRRLRDINEEKRLKTWIAQQVEREKEAADRKQKKLEKLCEKPKHNFEDESYYKQRSDLPEKVEDAVLQGLKAADGQQIGKKRKIPDEIPSKNKKPKLWVDADLDEFSTSDSDDSDVEPEKQHAPEINEASTSHSFSESGIDTNR